MATSSVVPDRSALYYPRIHFRDLEWLKGTLLVFGHVHRIVPGDYPLDEDPGELKAISERHGAKAPLIHEIDPEGSTIELAQERLLKELQASDPAEIARRFGRAAAAEAANKLGSYEIYRSKLHDGLLEMLLSRNLAWSERSAVGGDMWVAMHPALGDAIMSVTAVAGARMRGSDVVTDSVAMHASVAALDEGEILRETFRPAALPGTDLGPDRTAAQLAHVIMTTHFDVSALSFSDVAAMVKEGVSLRAFRNYLLTFAERVPPEVDQTRRDEIVKELAEEVVEEWNGFKKNLPRQLLTGFASGTAKGLEDVSKDAAKNLALLGLAAVTAHALLVTLAPLAVPIAFAVVGTAVAWRRSQTSGPFAYLTHVQKKGGIYLTVPCSYRHQR